MSDHWYASGNCSPHDPRLFDPIGRPEIGDAALKRIAAAKTVCAGCPVANLCLSEARRNRDSGVRGGLYLDRGRPIANPNRPGRTARIDQLRGAA